MKSKFIVSRSSALGSAGLDEVRHQIADFQSRLTFDSVGEAADDPG